MQRCLQAVPESGRTSAWRGLWGGAGREPVYCAQAWGLCSTRVGQAESYRAGEGREGSDPEKGNEGNLEEGQVRQAVDDAYH